MKLRRISTPAAPEPEQVSLDKDRDGAGKGRPTPKRNEARAARTKGGFSAPSSTKGARERARAERRRQSQEYRAAMMSGDVSRLPPREQAPERVFARDFVDTRRNLGPLFLVAALIYFVGGIIPNAYVRMIAAYVMLLGLLVVAIDSVVLVVQVTRRVRETYPDSRVRVRAYAMQRALMPRRWRLPRPRVARKAPAPPRP